MLSLVARVFSGALALAVCAVPCALVVAFIAKSAYLEVNDPENREDPPNK